MTDIKWINPLNDEYITYAAFVWKINQAEAWDRLDRAIKNEELSSPIPFEEFKEYVQVVSKARLDQQSDILYRYSKEPIHLPPSPKKKDFSWIWVIVILAGVWSLSLLFPGDTQTFLGGLAGLLVSLFVLYHTYLTGKVNPTFRAGCYIWLLFFGSISYMISGIGELTTLPLTSSSTPRPHATATSYRPPTITPAPTSDCLYWSQITPQMEGRTVCVYGTIHSLYSTNESWTRIKFADAPNTFFINDTSYIYYELKAGDCISATQTIQLYENVPYMEVSSVGLYNCSP